jgi:hypothetical protein
MLMVEVGQILAQLVLSDVIRDNEVCWPALSFSAKVKGVPGPGCPSDSNKRTENIKRKLFHANSDGHQFSFKLSPRP